MAHHPVRLDLVEGWSATGAYWPQPVVRHKVVAVEDDSLIPGSQLHTTTLSRSSTAHSPIQVVSHFEERPSFEDCTPKPTNLSQIIISPLPDPGCLELLPSKGVSAVQM
ncbi:hypothetical protein EOD39_11301 [Acipenser ruthenus]|uniref:Uncharacterized protein n=1 Tax=Acipenser ruthenus TaxID=7906 RepID=A0A444UPA1_ACIRT|nr:hypothetical protein EOD39_11301 [Acipenser ruthenus]